VLQQKEYEQELLTRYDPGIWKEHKAIVIVEEFIRYKLIAAKKEEFKDHLI
jgi:hypothetical protein